MNYLLFDIGGTRSRFSVSRDGEGFDDPQIVETPDDFDMAIEQFAQIAKQISGGQIDQAVGGIAGALNNEKTGVFRAPNLLGWHNRDFVGSFSEKISAPVHIENDTAIVGLGEAVFGPGRDHNIVVYITVSTGVNGAKISNKKIDENIWGFEIGHQIIDLDNSLEIGSSGLGTLEDFISGRETQKRFSMPPKEIKDDKEWRQIAEWASVGIYNTILHWSPEIVILGGSMMRDIPLAIIKDKLHNMLSEIYPDVPQIAKSELGSIGGLYGALHYAKGL